MCTKLNESIKMTKMGISSKSKCHLPELTFSKHLELTTSADSFSGGNPDIVTQAIRLHMSSQINST